MATSLQEQQKPIFERIAFALVQATPEHWTSAVLELTSSNAIEPVADTESGFGHSIFNTSHPRDMVFPTDEIYSATRELELLSRDFGDDWKRLIFKIEQSGNDWRYEVDIER